MYNSTDSLIAALRSSSAIPTELSRLLFIKRYCI